MLPISLNNTKRDGLTLIMIRQREELQIAEDSNCKSC